VLDTRNARRSRASPLAWRRFAGGLAEHVMQPPLAAPSRHWAVALTMLAILVVTAVVYWDSRAGALVWDDIVCLRDPAWMRQDDAWRTFFAHDFCGITNYFRPLAAGLFMLQVRAFDLDPASMHTVSLALHLANCLLVGLLTFALCGAGRTSRRLLLCAPMLIYALHPALVEPVAWISAQTELVVTFWMLLGLLLNVLLHRATARALLVALCFFLAACAKESAVAFPLALALCDWTRLRAPPAGTGAQIGALLRRHWQTYAGIVGAGILYLVLRHAQLGYVLNAGDSSALSGVARAQEVGFLYLTYWRLMVWPMLGLGPVHLFDEAQFGVLTAHALLIDAAAIAIASYGVVACYRRARGGLLVAGATVLLLPVLHVLPVTFDESLYHDRYVMAPLALALALLPDTLAPLLHGARLRQLALALIGIVWLGLALINIRVTLPLWADDIALWQWALRLHPQSISARENLFASYVVREDARAFGLARQLIAEPSPCATCLLNVAYFGMHEHDQALATAALTRLQENPVVTHDARLFGAYQVAAGRLFELQQDRSHAEAAYRAAMAAVPADPQPRLQLAMLLARAGDTDAARRIEQEALALLAPADRAEPQRQFEQALREAPGHEP